MSYTVLARRYRSTSFQQVIGQEPIAQTLQNAIAQGKVHHALLFTGTRGVGKTSMARIFACALNAPSVLPDCPSSPDDTDLPAVEVQQRMAEAIMRGDDMNVIEIDGASNNSVDDARELIANANLTPTGNSRYKIYIIDEVHMLTAQAFNALLKTMEEPPAHVKFILCTTEAHKVLPTIQSRCQRFDFRNIPSERIADHLTQVLEREGIGGEKQAVWQVARLANGSMRDALSILDRLIAGVAGDQAAITAELVEQMLGLPSQGLIDRLVETLARGDVAAGLEQTARLLESGLAQDQVVEALIERLRQLMLLIACGADSSLIELSDDAKADAMKQATHFDAPGLVHMIALCENLQRFSRVSANPRALLDATVVRLALAEKMAEVTALLQDPAPSQGKEKKNVAVMSPDPPVREPWSDPQTDSGTGAPSRSGLPAPSTPAPTTSRPADPAPSSPPCEAVSGEKATPVPPESAARADVWSAVVESTSQKASLSWIQSLALNEIDRDTVYLTTVPGRRDLVRFITAQRRQQLADLLGRVLHRPVQVEIGHHQKLEPVTKSDRDQRIDQRVVMALPTVREVMQHFDASLVDVQYQTETAPSGAVDDREGASAKADEESDREQDGQLYG